MHNVAHSYGKTATFMPKPIVGDNGSGMHVHQSVWKGGENLFAGNGYAGLSELALYYIGGIIKHAKALNAITNPAPTPTSVWCPGFEAPINLAYSARNRSAAVPHPLRVQPEGAPRRGALPGPHRQSLSGFCRHVDGRTGRDTEQDPPGRPGGQEPLRPAAGRGARRCPTSARRSSMALEEIEKDREFLTRGGVFSNDMLDAYIDLKMEEVTNFRMTTHPIEFAMYYSLLSL